MSIYVDFLLWRKGEDRDNFSFLLFHLIAKADMMNKERLRRSFPQHVKCYEKWMELDQDLSDQELYRHMVEWGITDL